MFIRQMNDGELSIDKHGGIVMLFGRRWGVVVVMGLLAVGFAFSAWAQTAADAGKLIGEAQRLFFQGKTQEADTTLKKVEAMFATAEKNKDEDSLIKLKLVDGRVKSLRKSIDTKMGKAAAPVTAPAQPQVKAGSTQEGTSQALPSPVTSRLKRAREAVEKGQTWMDEGQKTSARSALGNAQGLIGEIEQNYGTQIPMDHPDILATKALVAELQAKFDESDAQIASEKQAAANDAAAAQEASDQWLAKLKPYAMGLSSTEHDPERYFIGSYTDDMDEMNERARISLLVQAEMEDYRKNGPGEDASDQLKEMVRKLDYELVTFKDSCDTMAHSNLEQAEKDIDYLIGRMDEESKKIGTNQLPILMDKISFENARRPLDRAANLMGSDNERIIAVEKKYSEMLTKDAALRKARIADTRMIADKYSGSDAADLKKKAQEIVLAKYASAKALRTTLINDDWREESVVEWTDTTKSALQHRVTRYMAGQVAAKIGDETKIYTVHVAKDRRTDGSWGALKGHIMFEDPILEENVKK